MKAIVVYDNDGNIAAILEKREGESYNSLETEIPDGMTPERVEIVQGENISYPMVQFRYDVDIPKETNSEHDRLIRDIRERVAAGGDLRIIIGELPLSNAEKWELEEEVKHGI